MGADILRLLNGSKSRRKRLWPFAPTPLARNMQSNVTGVMRTKPMRKLVPWLTAVSLFSVPFGLIFLLNGSIADILLLDILGSALLAGSVAGLRKAL